MLGLTFYFAFISLMICMLDCAWILLRTDILMDGTKSNVGLIKDFPGDQARRVWPRGRGSLKGGALLNMCLPPSLVLYNGLRGWERNC